MALTSTMHRVHLDISDVDRGVYAQQELRVAQHPSESDAYLVARILAYALEYDPALAMGRGIAFPDEPSLSITDPTGQVTRWIEVGIPSADRLHRIAKSTDDVVLYAHRPLQPLLDELRNRPVHRADALQVTAFPGPFLDALAAHLGRQCRLAVLRHEGALYVTPADAAPIETPLQTRTLSQWAAPGP